MAHDPAMMFIAVITLTILWTTTVIAGVVWLNGKFRSVEGTIYREANKLKDANALVFKEHGDRLIMLEIKHFGYANVRPTPPPQS